MNILIQKTFLRIILKNFSLLSSFLSNERRNVLKNSQKKEMQISIQEETNFKFKNISNTIDNKKMKKRFSLDSKKRDSDILKIEIPKIVTHSKSLFELLSNSVQMIPIYCGILRDLPIDSNTETTSIGFLMGFGYSVVHNLLDIGMATRFPEIGETYQGIWDDGTMIFWEAIPGLFNTQGFLLFQFIIFMSIYI